MNARLLFHIFIAVISWALFGYYWWLVSQRRFTLDSIKALQLLASLVGLIWGATTLWIAHNQRRFAGRPERRKRRHVTATLSEYDSLGQKVEFEGSEPPEQALYLELVVDAETRRKRITTFDRPPRTSAAPLMHGARREGDEAEEVVGGAV